MTDALEKLVRQLLNAKYDSGDGTYLDQTELSVDLSHAMNSYDRNQILKQKLKDLLE